MTCEVTLYSAFINKKLALSIFFQETFLAMVISQILVMYYQFVSRQQFD